MPRTFITGGVLAVVAALLALLGDTLGLDEARASLLGVLVGAAVAIVPAGATHLWRAGSLLIGIVIAWAGYALRAGLLPDSATGRAVAALLVVGLITVVCALTSDRLPLWAGLLGAATMAGAYETTFGIDPTEFVDESVLALSGLLLAAGAGVLVGALLSLFYARGAEEGGVAASPRHARNGDDDAATRPGLTILDKTAEVS